MADKNNTPTPEQLELDTLRAELAKVTAEKEELAKKNAPKTGTKATRKGGISVYGLQRFPVTLYPEQWEKVFTLADVIRSHTAEANANAEAWAKLSDAEKAIIEAESKKKAA